MKHSEKIILTNKIADAIQQGSNMMGYIGEDGTYKFPLPSPQVTGTMMQQRSYAVSRAIDMVSRHEKFLVD
jgi:hypothetical protein